jgi:hypothetical protein
LATFALAFCAVARAQSPEGPRVSAEERRAASQAYDRGSAAYIARDFARAATYFETAHRLAPAATALAQAARAHARAGNALRAATLALRLEATYPDESNAMAIATEILAANAERFFRVDVRCDGCAVELDGTLLEHPSFFVEPDTEHEVGGHFETGDVSERVTGGAGERREIVLEAPPEAPASAPEGPAPSTGGGGGLSPIFSIAAGALAVGAGGVLIWSGVDTLAGVDDYENDPTTEALAVGQSKETRTNVLIGVTAALAVTTLVLAIFTDWDGSEEVETRAALAPLAGGAGAIVEGRF